MEDIKVPRIESLQKITHEQAIEYVKYVATLRRYQRNYFATRYPLVLEKCRTMEKALDELNAELLNPTPKLF